jgi:hypothetical protein
MAFVVDDLGLSAQSVTEVRKQLRKYLAELQPNDLVAIIRTGGEVGALQQFTSDRRVLNRAVDRLRWNPCSRVGLFIFQPAGAPPVGGGKLRRWFGLRYATCAEIHTGWNGPIAGSQINGGVIGQYTHRETGRGPERLRERLTRPDRQTLYLRVWPTQGSAIPRLCEKLLEKAIRASVVILFSRYPGVGNHGAHGGGFHR